LPNWYLIPEFESVVGVPECPGLKVLLGQLQHEVALQGVLSVRVTDVGRTQTKLKNMIKKTIEDFKMIVIGHLWLSTI